jgi:hypothetical protein
MKRSYTAGFSLQRRQLFEKAALFETEYAVFLGDLFAVCLHQADGIRFDGVGFVAMDTVEFFHNRVCANFVRFAVRAYTEAPV